ncbi:MAG TPA: hypothetical protein VFR81_06480 [Longimicrobium sp.]|nr:hypothetical protein [Longimicrobium sp.]
MAADPRTRRHIFSLRRAIPVAALLIGIAAAATAIVQARPHGPKTGVEKDAAPPGSARDFDEHIRRERDIRLAESQSVLNVNPRVEVDRLGGFLIADANEAQVRRYAPDGRLLWAFGRKGQGPGEFLRLSTALRTRGDTILAAEISGRVSLIDPAGSRLARLRQTGLGPLYDGTLVGDSLVVFAAREGGKVDTPLLHVWNVGKDSVTSRFFRTPAAPRGLESAYAFAGTADVAARGDTLAAVFALSDTVFLFDVRGRLLERVPIPFQRFRRPTEPMPKLAGIDEYRKWASGFSAISQIHWLSDGSFIIQYFDTDGMTPRWRLAHLTRRGRRLFEVLDSPQLLAVSQASDSLYFVTPDAETPAFLTAASVVR